MVNQSRVRLASYKQEDFTFSERFVAFLNKNASLLYQISRNQEKTGCKKCYEKADLVHCVANENEAANQNSIVQYVHPIYFDKGLFWIFSGLRRFV